MEYVRQAIREVGSRRARSEVWYLLIAPLITLLGVLYVVVALVLGAALAVTAVGIPLISWAVPFSRRFGSLRRRLTNKLLDERVTAPFPFQPPRGFLAKVSAGLRDPVGWRGIGFLLLAVALDAVGGYLVLITWVWGLLAITYPVQFTFGADKALLPDGGRGLFLHVVPVTSAPGVFGVFVVGAGLLLVAPWAVRAYVAVDRLLVRNLLGGQGAAARIRDLERSRAYAIEDVAATLRRIERDLHDGVQARMVALAMSLTMLNETLGPDTSEQNRDLLAAALAHAKDGIAELRQMVSGIHPPALDAGLTTALGTLAARSPIPVDVRGDLPERPTEAIETIAYFTVAELLTNVTKHSGAQRATVELSQAEGRLVVCVSDDGRGGASLSTPGTGLRGLTERVGTVDGRLAVDSPEGGPTVVTVELPLHVRG
ncbi:MAG TPA: sensor domain-containing protein [Pseudonocardiaceae bacterium]|nr:sensor domain-containing protein [Pseudonocardiaceae bacterium]